MPTSTYLLPEFTQMGKLNTVSSAKPFGLFFKAFVASLLLLLLWVITGCGSGGYAGGAGIVSLSATAVTIDSGQAFSVTSKVDGAIPVAWTLAGTGCSGNSCGTISNSSGPSTLYTSPANLTGQMMVTLTAALPGTQSRQIVSITVNPDPVIAGNPPPGIVGVSYSATLTASGGTGLLKWSLSSGTPPAGLSFNTATGVISGTPTVAGTTSFTVQVVDTSDIPFTVQANETIVVTTTVAALSLTGNPPAGTVGTAYSSALAASGGAAPYTYSVLSGTLPTGLGLAPGTGVISGVPTTNGTFTFTAQVQDSTGVKANAIFSITISGSGAGGVLTLATATLPNGTVGVPYSATIGVSGGTSPYTCVFTAGSLPAGLTLSGCVVSGTPTAAGTSLLTVKATDAANPAATGTGPESITIAAAPSLAITSPPGAEPWGSPTAGRLVSLAVPLRITAS